MIAASGGSARAILRETTAGLVVAFPGTDNVMTWLTDLDALITSVPNLGEVHRGFWEAWQLISEPLQSAIGARPVTLVGHSLGAALAILAGAALSMASHRVVGIYGFEPPRVSLGSDLQAVLALGPVPLYLTRNGNDLVPDVPFGFQHAGALTQVGRASVPFPNIDDHAIERVIEALSPSII